MKSYYFHQPKNIASKKAIALNNVLIGVKDFFVVVNYILRVEFLNCLIKLLDRMTKNIKNDNYNQEDSNSTNMMFH